MRQGIWKDIFIHRHQEIEEKNEFAVYFVRRESYTCSIKQEKVVLFIAKSTHHVNLYFAFTGSSTRFHLSFSKMLRLICLSLLVNFERGFGHGGHESTGPLHGETIQQYAQRHVRIYNPISLNFSFSSQVIDVFRTSYVRLTRPIPFGLIKMTYWH